MRIVLNGESREVPEACSVASLLAQLQLKDEGVAVEVNLNIIDRRAFAATCLQDGDRVELIGFIGGGKETGA
jgi:thiamine biosynthesis protein ThiS